MRRCFLASVLAVGGLGCSGDDEAAGERPAAVSSAETVDWSARLQEPTVAVLLEALAQPHAVARTSLGPHRLRYVADVSLVDPQGELVEHPDVDAPVFRDQQVHDEVELLWATAEGDPVFSLHQENDHDRGREVVVTGGKMYSKQRFRPWVHFPLQTEVYELWLDDAQRSALGVVELAAPALKIDVGPSDQAGIGDGETISVALSLAGGTDDAVRRSGPTSDWRAQADITSITGQLVLDRATGLWLSAEVQVQYALQGADGRKLRGHVQFEGSVQPLAQGEASVQAPAEAMPLPERTRLQVQRQELLDGLAAPR